MNFGVVFCAVGVALWTIQIIYKITVCANSKENLPSWKDYKEYGVDETTKRDIRAVKIGAFFFFLVGVLGWSITVGNPGVYMDDGQLLYAIDRLLLPLFLYLNASMRLLIYRLSGSKSDLTGRAEIIASLRFTGLSPQGEDIASRIVRWTNILFVLVLASFIFLIYKGV